MRVIRIQNPEISQEDLRGGGTGSGVDNVDFLSTNTILKNNIKEGIQTKMQNLCAGREQGNNPWMPSLIIPLSSLQTDVISGKKIETLE